MRSRFRRFRRFYNGRPAVPRPSRTYGPLHLFKFRLHSTLTMHASATDITEGSTIITYQLSDSQRIANIVSNFDEYRLSKVYFKIVPRITNLADVNLGNSIPRMLYCSNYGLNQAATYASLLQIGAVRHVVQLRPAGFMFTPRIRADVNAEGGNYMAANLYPPWISTATPDVKHHGVMLAWSRDTMDNPVDVKYDIYSCVYVQARRPI